MTKKDYELIARAFADVRAAYSDRDSELQALATLAKTLADDLAQENPKFLRSRFLIACEVQS